MKLQGTPNLNINMDFSLTIKCDDKGIIDLDQTLDLILSKILIPRLTPNYPVIKDKKETVVEKIEELVEEEKIDTTEKIYTCKTCGEEVQGMGKYLAHCRTHKKEGDS